MYSVYGCQHIYLKQQQQILIYNNISLDMVYQHYHHCRTRLPQIRLARVVTLDNSSSSDIVPSIVWDNVSRCFSVLLCQFSICIRLSYHYRARRPKLAMIGRDSETECVRLRESEKGSERAREQRDREREGGREGE